MLSNSAISPVTISQEIYAASKDVTVYFFRTNGAHFIVSIWEILFYNTLPPTLHKGPALEIMVLIKQ